MDGDSVVLHFCSRCGHAVMRVVSLKQNNCVINILSTDLLQTWKIHSKLLFKAY